MPTVPKEPSSFDTTQIVLLIVTLVLVVTCCFMWASGRDLPAPLYSLTTLMLGLFVGGRMPASGVKQMAASIKAFAAAIE